MIDWCKRHPILFMAGYLVFYLVCFGALEHFIKPEWIVHCFLDDWIPFCKYAVIPYFAWFVWVPATLFWLLFTQPRQEFWRLCLPLFGGMTLCVGPVRPHPQRGGPAPGLHPRQRLLHPGGAAAVGSGHRHQRLALHPRL